MPDESVPMIPGAAATSAPEAGQFTIAGRVNAWEPQERKLRIGARMLWVAATLRIFGLEVGAKVVASGHEEDAGGRWIVTQLTLGSPTPKGT
jgi:hypothetical protein